MADHSLAVYSSVPLADCQHRLRAISRVGDFDRAVSKAATGTCYTANMTEPFADILTAGGKTNSLGRASEVIETVLADRSRLDELYGCLFDENAWVRMRAADAFEKVCRQHPDWLLPYVDRFPAELAVSSQPSLQWHLAQIYAQIELTDRQKRFALDWLKGLLSTTEVDWIVSANTMDTLRQFVNDGSFSKSELVALAKIQQGHHSKAVVKRAGKLLEQLQ